MTRVEQGVAHFRAGCNCAQSVLCAHGDALGLTQDLALQLASGFGAGMGRAQDTCGAVTGGIMVLGLRHGKGAPGDRVVIDAAYAKTLELLTRFRQKHGTCGCRELLGGCDLKTEEGRQTFKDQNLRDRVCIPCVESVLTILDDLAAPPIA